MEMKTERLIVRTCRFEDDLDLFEMCCDVQTARMAGWQPHDTLQITKNIIAGHIYEEDTYAIILKSENKLIGTISLYDNNKKGVKSRELGFCLNKNYRKKGYMVEAAKLVLDIAFRALRVDVVTTCHATFNTDCKKVIDKLPFKSQGITKNYRKLYDGTMCDCELYTIVKEDY